jgi:polysaccharide deacetylase family protein (PEP-CTERM system associated)
MAAEKQNVDANSSTAKHIMSVDVEDYFMVEAFADSVPRSSWNTWPSRVVANTQRILGLFDKHDIKCTFFFVGWVAHKYPHLVREVSERGHELGCHSFWHRAVYSLTPEQFREDTHAAASAIEDATGAKVYGYRAPSWSITKECLWALDILAEQGFTYDSSIFPIHHDLYGVAGAKRFPHTVHCKNGLTLREYPPATVRLWGQNFPGAGGGYLRILPMAYTRWVFRKFEREYGERVVAYVHPWEIDSAQPRIKDKLRSTIRHYTNLEVMEARLERLLGEFRFQSFENIARSESRTADSSSPAAVGVMREALLGGTARYRG